MMQGVVVVFPECNQHPVVSFILYDHTHGTRLSEVNSLFMDAELREESWEPLATTRPRAGLGGDARALIL